MKKNIIFIFIILLLTCACSSSNLKKLNIKSLNNLLNKNETFILYLTDESDGKVLKKTLNEVCKDNNLEAYYINTLSLKDEDLKSLKSLFTYDETNIILFIKNGNEETVLSRINDLYINKFDLEQEFKNQGYIKENN